MRRGVESIETCSGGEGGMQPGCLRNTIKIQPMDRAFASKNSGQLLNLVPIRDPLLNILRKRRVTALKSQPSIIPVEEILRARSIVKFLYPVITLQSEI